MFPIAVAIFTVLCAWKWGDWKNWLQYLPTIQYFIIGDMLYNLFTWNYPLWSYPHPPGLLPSHLLNNFIIMFFIYPSTMFIFLYRFPKNHFIKQILYIIIWIVLWGLYEYIMVINGLCVYSNGWTYGWSIIFAGIMVSMLLLHYKRPLWAYVLSVPITVLLLIWFQVPIFHSK